ncbi:MAG: hypothetical protein RL235_329 [Chlamydiota bacterium]|jgi:hypothetical protein
MTIDPTVPQELYALQTWFAKWLSQPMRPYGSAATRELRRIVADGPSLRGDQRFAIYNQQYWLRLYSALQKEFPTLLALFGDQEFNASLAEPYFLSHPPKDWSLRRIGRYLAHWLFCHYHDDDRWLVLAIASLDDAYERAWWERSLAPVQMGQEEKALSLQPFVIPLTLQCDLVSFRTLLLQRPAEDWIEQPLPPIDPSGPFFVVIYRNPQHQICHEVISEKEYYFLKAFDNPLGTMIADVCIGMEDASDVASWLSKWGARQWLSVKTQ